MKNETRNTTRNENNSTNRSTNGNSSTTSRTERRRQQLTAYKNAAALIIIIVCSIVSGYVEGHAATLAAPQKATTAGRKPANGNRTKRGTTAARKASQKPRKDDKSIIRDFIRTTYGDEYKARIQAAEKTPDSVITSRAGKHTVYVDMFITKADSPTGGHVTTPGPFQGNRIRYAHQAKPGDVVKVYWIYNPHTNAEDDITAIISGGQIWK